MLLQTSFGPSATQIKLGCRGESTYVSDNNLDYYLLDSPCMPCPTSLAILGLEHSLWAPNAHPGITSAALLSPSASSIRGRSEKSEQSEVSESQAGRCSHHRRPNCCVCDLPVHAYVGLVPQHVYRTYAATE
ncbi:hypothetical protein PLICRDRAFT_420837 [Plicaturopsis crispa FD-325 SS-3]|nr:hypothetical protein PLICRDRAFT_420837 [Plicaturopsis crispa FD-325 SS-3]